MKTENFIQQEIVMWFTNNYCLSKHTPRCMILSIPNGGGRDGREGKTLKNTGLLKGASDLILVLPKATHYVEVKTETGYQSPEQIEFEKRVRSLGQSYHLVRSLGQFKELVGRFL